MNYTEQVFERLDQIKRLEVEMEKGNFDNIKAYYRLQEELSDIYEECLLLAEKNGYTPYSTAIMAEAFRIMYIIKEK